MAETAATAPPRESWGTRFGVILAVMGSAVGLGNFLRFPGLAAKYEGGAFMIPYFVAFLLLGLPMAWVEWAIGRHGGARGYNSAPGIYRVLTRNPVVPYFGALAVLVPVVIYMYYVVIEAWCLGYAWYMASGRLSLGTADNAPYVELFTRFAGVSENGLGISSDGGVVVVLVLLCFLLNFVLIYRGLTKGIEWFCTLAMPVLIGCALIVLVRVLTLGTPNPAKPELNVLSGLGFMWNPHTAKLSFWQALSNGQMWLEAAGQIFFSLSVGFGIIINYSSYLKRNDDIVLSGLTSAAGNEFCEVALGGLITVPAAFIFLGAAGAGGSSFTLGFITLPMVFASMPGGQVIGTIFFTLLFLAALTSSLSMLQPAIALLEEGLCLGRRASVAVLGFITFIGAMFVMYFSKDLVALDTFDFWIGTFCIYVLAMFQVVLWGRTFGVERGYREITNGAEIRLPRLVLYVMQYVSPAYLVVVFVAFVWQQLTTPADNRFAALKSNLTVQLSVGFIVALGALFCLLVSQSVRRWSRQDEARGFEVNPP